MFHSRRLASWILFTSFKTTMPRRTMMALPTKATARTTINTNTAAKTALLLKQIATLMSTTPSVGMHPSLAPLVKGHTGAPLVKGHH